MAQKRHIHKPKREKETSYGKRTVFQHERDGSVRLLGQRAGWQERWRRRHRFIVPPHRCGGHEQGCAVHSGRGHAGSSSWQEGQLRDRVRSELLVLGDARRFSHLPLRLDDLPLHRHCERSQGSEGRLQHAFRRRGRSLSSLRQPQHERRHDQAVICSSTERGRTTLRRCALFFITTTSERSHRVKSYHQTRRGSASSRREDGEMNNSKEPQMI